MDKTLKEIMEDMPETEVKKAEIIVKVVGKITENRFKVEDSTLSTYIEFQPEARRMRNRVEVGVVFRFFSLEKINNETLMFRKNSFLMKEKMNALSETENNSHKYNTTHELVTKTAKSFVKDEVMLKVLRIYDPRTTSRGTPFCKVLLADNNFQLHITFWRDEAQNASKLLEQDSIYLISCFTVDSWPTDTNGERPKDIVYEKNRTKFEKVEMKNIPSSFDAVKINDNSKTLLGKIRFLDYIYEYKSCPGKTVFCGKAVKSGQLFCSKIGCSLQLDQDKLVLLHSPKL